MVVEFGFFRWDEGWLFRTKRMLWGGREKGREAGVLWLDRWTGLRLWL